MDWRRNLVEDYVYLTTNDESDFKFDLTNTNMISSIESVKKRICSKVKIVVFAGWYLFFSFSYVAILISSSSISMMMLSITMIYVSNNIGSFLYSNFIDHVIFRFDSERRSGFVFFWIRFLRKWYLRYVFFIERSWRFFIMILE